MLVVLSHQYAERHVTLVARGNGLHRAEMAELQPSLTAMTVHRVKATCAPIQDDAVLDVHHSDHPHLILPNEAALWLGSFAVRDDSNLACWMPGAIEVCHDHVQRPRRMMEKLIAKNMENPRIHGMIYRKRVKRVPEQVIRLSGHAQCTNTVLTQ